MNQKLQQHSENNVEKDFYKLMNNSNFGFDCRNNLDNCKSVPIFDEYKEITFISQYHNIFDSKFSEFVTAELWKNSCYSCGCGKTTFLEKLDLNNIFGKIVKTQWISGFDIDKKREAEIQSYFSNEKEVHVAKEQDELDSFTLLRFLLESFKLRSREETTEDNVNISFGKNKKLD